MWYKTYGIFDQGSSRWDYTANHDLQRSSEKTAYIYEIRDLQSRTCRMPAMHNPHCLHARLPITLGSWLVELSDGCRHIKIFVAK